MKRILLLLVGAFFPALVHADELSKPIDPNNLRHTVTVDVVEKTKDSVVYISSRKMVAQQFSVLGGDPFFRNIGPQQVRMVPSDSLGSGFVIHADGYVITHNHVIDRARQISVEFVNGKKYEAELVGADSEADLAVLKIIGEGLPRFPAVELGDSGNLLIGEPTIAVGNPLGYSHSVSTGIVSAIHRDLKNDGGGLMLGDLIQTDAAINPGNSGGPLLNAYGQVIGINTAIRTDAQNIGFAIQINKLRDMLPTLMNPTVVTKVEVPIKFAERRVTAPPASVTATVFESGKELKSIDGKPVSTIIDAQAALLRTAADSSITLAFADGSERTVETKRVPTPDAIVQARAKLGIVIEELSPASAQKYGLPLDEGLLVTEVMRDTPASRLGIRPGDIVLQLGTRGVSTLAKLSDLLPAIPEHGRVRVGILRGEEMRVGVLQF